MDIVPGRGSRVGAPVSRVPNPPASNALPRMDGRIRECLERASYCRQLAEDERDPKMRAYLLKLSADPRARAPFFRPIGTELVPPGLLRSQARAACPAADRGILPSCAGGNCGKCETKERGPCRTASACGARC